jgi:hypothetical protein
MKKLSWMHFTKTSGKPMPLLVLVGDTERRSLLKNEILYKRAEQVQKTGYDIIRYPIGRMLWVCRFSLMMIHSYFVSEAIVSHKGEFVLPVLQGGGHCQDSEVRWEGNPVQPRQRIHNKKQTGTRKYI